MGEEKINLQRPIPQGVRPMGEGEKDLKSIEKYDHLAVVRIMTEEWYSTWLVDQSMLSYFLLISNFLLIFASILLLAEGGG
jgi:hypothetical protein